MSANSITEARVQKAVKKSAIKDTTAPLVFLVTFFVGFLIGYPLIKSIAGLAIIIVIAIPTASTILVIRKRRTQIEEITQAYQTTIDQNRAYSGGVLEKSLSKASKAFSDAGYEYTLAIDQTAHKWALIFPSKKLQYILEFSALIDFSIYEDGNRIALGTQLNGISFGTVTDICKDLHIEIVANTAKQSRFVIPLITEDAAHNSTEYRYAVDSAKEICSLLSIVKAENAALHMPAVTAANVPVQQAIPSTSHGCDLDDLGKLFKLKQQGIITEEEFDVKKRQILGL